ncbi:hypothetical protein K438DRAFT_1758729 [Mycena galopus ATCC 62051]|nr:hypothetical protein K438DRAFT_1758729 [Mycena galopus ATCC 62051]
MSGYMIRPKLGPEMADAIQKHDAKIIFAHGTCEELPFSSKCDASVIHQIFAGNDEPRSGFCGTRRHNCSRRSFYARRFIADKDSILRRSISKKTRNGQIAAKCTRSSRASHNPCPNFFLGRTQLLSSFWEGGRRGRPREGKTYDDEGGALATSSFP